MISRERIRHIMAIVVANQGKTASLDDDIDLATIPFRSLDFVELTLRVEDDMGGEEMNFDATGIRRVRTVGDLLDLIQALGESRDV